MAPGQGKSPFRSALHAPAFRTGIVLTLFLFLVGDSHQIVHFLTHSFSQLSREESGKENKESEEAGKLLTSGKRSWRLSGRENDRRLGHKNLLAGQGPQELGHGRVSNLTNPTIINHTLADVLRIPLRC
jgi:hypothetical protein